MKQVYALFFSLTFLGLLPQWSAASHIVGGYVSYECLALGRYRVTLNMYVNCNSQANDYFPTIAPVTIFRGDAPPYETIGTLPVPISWPPTSIPLDDNPCVILPPDICVEEGQYVFEVDLPVADESYHIVFQRCCRNASITNIVAPARSGATFSLEILPAAQTLCNSSPAYNAYPPAVICVNQPMEIDHSAIDPDSDELVYSLCSPLLGAGLEGTSQGTGGNAEDCDGYRPDPACPPPFDRVPFIQPDYSAQVPIPGSPPMRISSTTGLLTGFPNLQGQFAVGLCVSEYRNGQLLSVIRRDFQFNITYCEERLRSAVVADEVIPETDTYLLNSCGEKTINFINSSTIESFIDEYRWEFTLGGVPQTYSSKNLLLTFPDYGTYRGLLILNPENDVCRDTGWIQVNIFPEPVADFVFEYDTCVAGDVVFSDRSTSSGGAVVDWRYDFGDGQSSVEPNPAHLFAFPGLHQVYLEIRDTNSCTAVRRKAVNWQPAPALVVVEPSLFKGCAPQEVFFRNLSFPIDSNYLIEWDLGDGQSSMDISPVHLYEEVGLYSLHVGITSPLGCYVEESWEDWIKVNPDPVARFSYSPDGGLTNFASEVTFYDESEGAKYWEWYFNEIDFSYGREASYTFPDTGQQKVLLLVENEFGCIDSLERLVDIVPEITYFLPNAFSPNGDGLNESYQGKGYFRGLYDFEMLIINRWGEVIFTSHDPEMGWNGRKENVGDFAPNGVYPVMVRYREPRGRLQQIRGFATLIR